MRAGPPGIWHTLTYTASSGAYGLDEWSDLVSTSILSYRECVTYAEQIIRALERSGRSAREVSIAATGHESAVRSLRRGLDLRASTIDLLCRELGLEFYVGPQREDSVAGPIAAALGLSGGASAREAVAAIEGMTAPTHGVDGDDLVPVSDRRIAEMVSALVNAWEDESEAGRRDMLVRWQHFFPDLAARAPHLSRVVALLGWRAVRK